ncbi:MAG: hypothetical protein AABZ06_07545 [Bdellovibrionota bacterium]
MKKKFVIHLAICGLFIGCNQNPFPTVGMKLEKKPPEPRVVVPPYSIDVPEIMEFTEGTIAEYKIVTNVPQGTKPMLSIFGLPDGAVFSETDTKLSWTPPYDAANDAKNPSIIMRHYPIRLVLQADADHLTLIERSAFFIVKDVPQPIEINIQDNNNNEVDEGDEFIKDIYVSSRDFPDGPFQLLASDLPIGAIIEIEADEDDKKHFVIRYTPDFYTVNLGDDNNLNRWYTKTFDVTITATAPRALQKDTKIEINVNDKRQYARISAPSSLSQGLDVSFVIMAEDPNGEVRPRISLEQDPSFGKIELTDLTYQDDIATKRQTPEGDNLFTVAHVRWTDIPADQIGKYYDLKFEICVKSSRYSMYHCNNHTVRVNFEINRTNRPG